MNKVFAETKEDRRKNGDSLILNFAIGSFCNASDAEANQKLAEILRTKKKRKKGFRLHFGLICLF